MKGIEQEFKWDGGTPKAFERFLIALKKECDSLSVCKQIEITDYYLDDEEETLSRQKIALRIRRSGRNWESTCKSRSHLKKGLAVRQEKTFSLARMQTIKNVLRELTSSCIWKKISKKGDLKVRFKIRNHRRVYLASYKNCLCEAALDNYVTFAGGHQMRRKEIELELKKGSTKDFKELIKKISVSSELMPSKISKVAGAEKWILRKFRLA